jgi:hypothetical protein
VEEVGPFDGVPTTGEPTFHWNVNGPVPPDTVAVADPDAVPALVICCDTAAGDIDTDIGLGIAAIAEAPTDG